MKLLLQIQKKTPWNQVGDWMSLIGFSIFVFSFWFPNGLHLGGTAGALGGVQPSLEVVLPMSGMGLIMIFVGQLLENKFVSEHVRWKLILAFLLGECLLAMMSVNPAISILYLFVWTLGLMSAGYRNLFWIAGHEKRWLLLYGIIIGTLASKLYPELGISNDIIAMGAVLGTLFALMEQDFVGKELVVFFYTWVVFESYNVGLILIFAALCLSTAFWLPISHNYKSRTFYFVPPIFLLGLIMWAGSNGLFTLPTFPNELRIGDYWFAGVGEGQFLTALPKLAKVPTQMLDFSLPDWGMLLTFFEKGLTGILLTGLLILTPVVFGHKRGLLFSITFLGFWVVSPDLASSECGILLLGAFLFAQENGVRPKRI